MPRDSKGRFLAGIEVSVTDRSPSWIRRILRGFDDMTKAGRKAAKSFELSANLKQAADNINEFSDQIGRVVKKPIKTFMDFEAQMSKVRAATFSGDVSDEAKRGFEELSAAARQLGADTQFSGMEAAEGMEILATQGFKVAEQIAAMPGILDVAAASTESIATAADISTAAMTQFGLKATDMGRIGDVLVKTSDASASGLVDIGEALKYVGANAGAAGASIETTTAMIGALSNAGIKGSNAGTALRAIFSGFQAPTKQGKSALQFLGINPKDKKGNLRPVEELLGEIDKAMDKKFGAGKGGTRRAALFKAMFGEEAASSAGILARSAGSGKLDELITTNEGSAGTAAAKAADVSNNAAGAAKELDSALEELQLTVGELVVPAIAEMLVGVRETVIAFTGWAKENPELVKTVVAVAGALAAIGLTAGPVLKGVAALNTLVSVVRVATAVMIANPILAIIAAVALAAYLIYDNWDQVSEFFKKHWKAIAIAFAPIMPLLAPFIAAGKLIMDNWEPIKDFFAGVWDSITSGAKKAFDWILEAIGWVGEKVEAFSIAVMSPEEAAAYAAQKAAEVESNARASGLFADDLDARDPNMETQGVGRWDTPTQLSDAAANNAAYALDQLQNNDLTRAFKAYTGQRAANADAGEAVFAAQGPALIKPSDTAQPVSKIFDGKLLITIDSNGVVTKTDMTTSGDPNFEARVNRGSQSAA